MIDLPLVVNVMLGVCAGIILFHVVLVLVSVTTGSLPSLSVINRKLHDIHQALEKLEAIEGQLGLIKWEIEHFRDRFER